MFASGFADDLKFVAILQHHSHATIQDNLNRVYSWSILMGMPLSLDKCCVVHCGLDNPHATYRCGPQSLSVSDCVIDLGVKRCPDGSFSEHILSLGQKSRRLVGLCLKSFHCRDPSFMMRVYKSYVLPVLTYASQVWSPHLRKEVDELEAIQRRFTKRIAGQRHLPYRERLINLSLLSLESQRIEADMIFVYKLCHNLVGVSLKDVGLSISTSNTRGGGFRLQQEIVTSTSAAAHFRYRAANTWNSLPFNIIQSITLSSFKSSLRDWLMSVDSAFF
jgi:hypothetical protein